MNKASLSKCYGLSDQMLSCTHVKISQLVASLQTSRQQVVFARLVTSFSTSLEQAVNNL